MKLEHFSFEYFSAPCCHILRWCMRRCSESAALNMSGNLENSAVATGLEKATFHSNPKEEQCQRMSKLLHKCNHLTR